MTITIHNIKLLQYVDARLISDGGDDDTIGSEATLKQYVDAQINERLVSVGTSDPDVQINKVNGRIETLRQSIDVFLCRSVLYSLNSRLCVCANFRVDSATAVSSVVCVGGSGLCPVVLPRTLLSFPPLAVTVQSHWKTTTPARLTTLIIIFLLPVCGQHPVFVFGAASPTVFKSKLRGKVLKSQKREVISNVVDFMSREGKEGTFVIDPKKVSRCRCRCFAANSNPYKCRKKKIS
ncbi:hypothetical protein J6590_094306 [Homalodisca vitripennis]|nr:hypothetical protein J6590_094306 [Homalodisca vitripennis]